MPIFEYVCECGCEFEQLLKSSNLENVVCGVCGSPNLELLPSRFATSNTAIHASERPVIFRNPRTGEIRYPATRDAELHPKYAAQGFQRQEAFTTYGERDTYEKQTGRIHERSHYNPGSGNADKDLTPPDPAASLAKFQSTKTHAKA